MAESTPPFRSSIPELALPPEGFQSNIPAHLLASSTPEDVWLMEEMSKNTQATTFVLHAVLDTNKQVRTTNGRLLRAEDDVKSLRSAVAALQEDMEKVKPVTRIIAGTWRFVSRKPVAIMLGLALFYLAFYVYPYLLKEDPISLLKDIARAMLGL